ncbi:MAG: hypothetical protein EXQ85_06160 [Alphaproteobacteria bacterium]|nr:hypothetical protein [Alphaproteobacteria bacterium]
MRAEDVPSAQWAIVGEHAMPFRLWCRRVIGLVVLAQGLMLGACYESRQEVIPVSAGETIPMNSPITWGDGARTDFSYVALSRDYRFVHREKSGRTRNGTARTIRIRDTLYAVQLRYDDQALFEIVFFDIANNGIQPMEPLDSAAHAAGAPLAAH